MGTLFAWLVTLLGAFSLVALREKMVLFEVPGLKTLYQSWKQVLLAVAFWLLAEPIIGIFTTEQDVIDAARRYLAIVPLSLWGYGVVIITAGAFDAMGLSHYGLAQYLIRTAVLYVPLSFIASLFATSEAVFYGIAIANALAGVTVAAFALWWFGNHESAKAQTSMA